ncbi:hypothetical protein DFH11DRAFT_1777754 [Phellopilus nigrolimitatus]|nr:hypothetical protein DFH11DRAFT_1777754 [Phellopilus nigrolimitatus]
MLTNIHLTVFPVVIRDACELPSRFYWCMSLQTPHVPLCHLKYCTVIDLLLSVFTDHPLTGDPWETDCCGSGSGICKFSIPAGIFHVAVFHLDLPLLVSGSEDGTVKLWNSGTYCLENTLSYVLERTWVVKLGRDEPALSMDPAGKLVYTQAAMDVKMRKGQCIRGLDTSLVLAPCTPASASAQRAQPARDERGGNVRGRVPPPPHVPNRRRSRDGDGPAPVARENAHGRPRAARAARGAPRGCEKEIKGTQTHQGVAGLVGSASEHHRGMRRHFIIDEHMLELDTTIMTLAPVFETSGHVGRFADWMVKDTKTGDVLRAGHLVKGVLEARLAGDKEARGVSAVLVKEDDKKRKKKVKTTAVKLEDETVGEYESILAQMQSADEGSTILYTTRGTKRHNWLYVPTSPAPIATFAFLPPACTSGRGRGSAVALLLADATLPVFDVEARRFPA